jgi:hypothetical protein
MEAQWNGPAHAYGQLRDHLVRLGLRHPRRQDLRRAFVPLAQVDGARRDLLQVVTHQRGDIMSLSCSFPWPARCAEVAKPRINPLATF